MWDFLPWILGGALVVEFFRHRARLSACRKHLRETSSRLAETELRLQASRDDAVKRQAALFDRMIEGVLILDGKGRVQLVNAVLKNLFQLNFEVRGKRLLEAIRSHELDEIVHLASEQGHVSGQEMFIGNGSDSRCFSVNAASFRESDDESGVIVVLHDLTEIKQLESGRREFVANVSHELRTPLSMIKGYVETLLGGTADDPLIRSRFLGKIQKHSDRLTYLIEDLLALSQLEADQIALSYARVPLASLVERTFEDLTDRAANRGIGLKADLDKDLQVWVDPDRLLQVLQNLIDNGIKYGRRDGSVVVKASATTEDGFVQIQVIDDGPGIPESARDRVFERFFRVDKARSREQGGTGLGLAIVKHIIQSHGGRVWLETNEGNGAAFCFTVPVDTKIRPSRDSNVSQS